MDSKRLNVKITVSVQLQKAINHTRGQIRVLSSETIGHFKKIKYRNEFVFQYRAALLSLSGLLTLKREPFLLLHKDLSASFKAKFLIFI